MLSPSSMLKLKFEFTQQRGRKGDGWNACAWQTWQGYYVRVLSWFSPDIKVARLDFLAGIPPKFEH